MITLSLDLAFPAQCRQYSVVCDPFGGDRGTKKVAGLDDEFDQGCDIGVGGESPIDLHDVDRQHHQMGERRVARAEIVNGRTDSSCSEFGEFVRLLFLDSQWF